MNNAFYCIYRGEYTKAIEQFNKVAIQKPDCILALNNIAVCKVFDLRPQEGLQIIQKLLLSASKH